MFGRSIVSNHPQFSNAANSTLSTVPVLSTRLTFPLFCVDVEKAPAGILLRPKGKYILNIAGDGSIQMNIQELMTCVDYKFKVINCIINNGYLGMVRQWQEKIYSKHYSQTKISSPDFVKLAQSYGALGIRVEKEEDIIPALKQAIEFDGPVMIDFVCENFEMVYPWVLAGQPIDNVLLSREEV